LKISARNVLILSLFIGVFSFGSASEDEKYSVSDLHAHLYYQDSGEIDSTDLLDGKDHALWNTVIGEGEARKPSSAILVLVDLKGPLFEEQGGSLSVKAAEDKKILLNQTLRLALWSDRGRKMVVPFLVYNTGCHHLEITATLVGLPDASVQNGAMRKAIPFKCGE
jgi:hypothetical protein